MEEEENSPTKVEISLAKSGENGIDKTLVRLKQGLH